MNTNQIKNLIIVVLVIVIGFFLLKKNSSPAPVTTPPAPTPVVTEKTPVSITKKDIKETYFTGNVAVISGSSLLATTSQKYVDDTVAAFKTQADTDVPDMIAKFGKDAPPAHYSIDIGAKTVTSAKTESVVIDTYTYTGGANGNSTFKVYTADTKTGAILALSDVIKSDMQKTFTQFVKDMLNKWIPDGSDAPVVFPDSVSALTFDSFSNWSLDGKNLIIYFDKYAIGPGVLGEVSFPVPLSKIQEFLK